MRRIKTIVLIISMFVCLVACQKEEQQPLALEPVEEEETLQSEEQAESIFVHVCGAVQNEGVYELPAGSRVYEAIEEAGGFREDAATTEVNQAQVLEDASKLYVPTVAEVLDSQSKQGSKVNINKASKEELMTLPGVGESKAESIIRYREDQGAFQSIEDIMQISGIKEALYEKIKDLIKV